MNQETTAVQETLAEIGMSNGTLQPVTTTSYPQNERVRQGLAKRAAKGKFLPEPIGSADFTGHFKFGWVPTDALLIDPAYQRKLQKKKILKMARSWDQNKVGVFVVNKRPAHSQNEQTLFYVIDGQHRHAAMQLIDNYPEQVYCQIFEGLSLEEEALMFHDLDSERDNLTPGASFNALLAAKNPVALGIKDVADSLGFTLEMGKSESASNLRAFKTLQDMYRRVGTPGLTRILSVLKAAWPNQAKAASEPLLRGLELFFDKYPHADDERLVKVLAPSTPMYVIGTARRIQEDLSSVIYSAVGQTIRGMYNKGLRYKLSAWL